MSQEEKDEITNRFKQNNRFWGIVTGVIIAVCSSLIMLLFQWGVKTIHNDLSSRVERWDRAAVKVETISARLDAHEDLDSALTVKLLRRLPGLDER